MAAIFHTEARDHICRRQKKPMPAVLRLQEQQEAACSKASFSGKPENIWNIRRLASAIPGDPFTRQLRATYPKRTYVSY